MHARFHAPSLAPGDHLVELPPDEAAHLGRVLRLRAGAEVRVFDGRGHEFIGRVHLVQGARAVIEVGEAVAAPPEPSVALTLVQAVPKGDAMDQIVRDAVMLGAAGVVPLVSERAETTIGRIEASGRVARWQRIAVASAKQCGRAVVPGVHGPCSLPDALRDFAADRRYLLAEPGLSSLSAAGIGAVRADPVPRSALLVVGPEGGWTEAEMSMAGKAGCVALTLGGRTLRANAAALVGITALQCAWGDLG